MGQAKLRGSYADRKAEAIAAGRTPDTRSGREPAMRKVFRAGTDHAGTFKDSRGRVYEVPVEGGIRRIG